MTALEPCGCGNPGFLGGGSGEKYSIWCLRCSASTSDYSTEPEAIVAWNTMQLGPQLVDALKQCALTLQERGSSKYITLKAIDNLLARVQPATQKSESKNA